jgi:hypothetical protein
LEIWVRKEWRNVPSMRIHNESDILMLFIFIRIGGAQRIEKVIQRGLWVIIGMVVADTKPVIRLVFFDVTDIWTRHHPEALLGRNVPVHFLHNDGRCAWISVGTARSGLDEEHVRFSRAIGEDEVAWVDHLA